MVEKKKANIRIPIRVIKCAIGSFRYKTLSEKKGIKALFCCKAGKWRQNHCSDAMKLVTVLYDTKKWTTTEAKAHAKRRFKPSSKSYNVMY